MDPQHLVPGDVTLIENIVNYLKAKGIFDEFRHESLADVDTKSSCQNLSQRVDGYTSKFLANEVWHPDLNKNELRNKLRRHIDESGMLAVGADHVVEQVINPKINQLFLPKIVEVVHQYVKEQNEFLNKKPDTMISSDGVFSSERLVSDVPENKDKASISDPIADILSFSSSKAKSVSVSNTLPKTETAQHKLADPLKVEKKKEEKIIPVVEKSISENISDTVSIPAINDPKLQVDKEKDKIKKEEQEIQLEIPKKILKEEIKSEKKKVEDTKSSVNENTLIEENKTTVPVSSKPTLLSKKDNDKNKQKTKIGNTQKSTIVSNELKKPKKDSSDKCLEKHIKSKPSKSSKELLSPTKTVGPLKNLFKEEKGESSKSKPSDSSCSKTSELLPKKSKSSSKDHSNSKHKGHCEKSDKSIVSKGVDKNEPSTSQDSSNSEKGSKSVQYSSSYDSSQGSDQEKSSSNSKNERPKHFSKHAKKEQMEQQSDDNNKTLSDKKRSREDGESPSKKYKNEKESQQKLKDTLVIEAAKITSRSNSFGSTSSVSSSSNASKDNFLYNSDEAPESSVKDKRKKEIKQRDSCLNPSKTLPPPPPPPPPPSSSLSWELTSSAEMSSVEDTQSSSDSESSNSNEISEGSSSDSELESKDLIDSTLNESTLSSSTDNINAFYDIFLYSSSSASDEFEGFGKSPEKKNSYEDILKKMNESAISISSVHTSDLSSFDDELSSDNEFPSFTSDLKKRLTLKEAQELIQNRAILLERNKDNHSEQKIDANKQSLNKRYMQRSSSLLSSDDESLPSEPKRLSRRERKLNPRYSSSEYTSIFNCKKETFITKQTIPPVKNHSVNLSPELKKIDSQSETEKLPSKNLDHTKKTVHQNKIKKSQKNKSNLNIETEDELSEFSDSSKISSSDEIDSIMEKEKLFQENNKNNAVSDDDKSKLHRKIKAHSNSKLKKKSFSLKRKLEVAESSPVKRPCSQNSVDSSSSELVTKENKPFNNEKQSFLEEKLLNDCNLKTSDLTTDIKKDLFCKQKTNNNGDILGQKDKFFNNSHGKAISTPEKTNESETSKEFNSL